ncbi:M20 family metallopeptidase [Acuticoccus sp. I52.16.1]|uniref:M20 family metallopeptidase n=1 Tax=Acuticoccus sp. I52.16.1 TaxID=2928472 RepID=UPI001FD25480|nr:M20 family metallopeptidase [Acuticoccus sp. I52.16.1]UOM34621.1 M20 family metallopeptidase [Acuticoccus sp. I52.16.1]
MTEETDRLVAGLKPWIETESPTSDPARVDAMMDLATAELAAAGATIRRIPGRDGVGDHLRAAMPWGGDGPGILVLCHLDTVHPVGTLRTLPFHRDGDRLYGPGTADMKGGVFIALKAAAAVAAAETGGLPVRFLLTADEEIGSPTSRDLIEASAADARYVLVTEAARDGGKVVTSRKGVGIYELTATGRAAHAGANHAAGRSAIKEMARQILAIEALTDPVRGITLNVGQVHGGTVTNTVPERCVAYIDLRVTEDADFARVHAALSGLKPHDPDVTLSLTGGANRPAYTKRPEIAALFEHARALAAEIGFALEDLHSGGGSDGSFIAGRVPTLDGLGVDGAAAHTVEEHLFVSSLVPRMTLLRRLMETLR